MLDTFHAPASCAGVSTLFLEKPMADKHAAPADLVRRQPTARGGAPPPPPSAQMAEQLPPFVTLIEDVTNTVWFSSHTHDSWQRTINMMDDVKRRRNRDA
jgi:hypothetical protein